MVASGGVHAQLGLTAGVTMELVATAADEQLASDILAKGGVASGERYVILNPGGNNPAKRWPAERFARLADDLADLHNLTIVVNGSPAEAELVAQIAGLCKKARCVELPKLGITLGALKAVCRRAELMVTNDTGPRHIAAAFGVPVVSLFGPTDHRWTIIPTRADAPEVILTADPTLPESEVSNDHPERCAIEKIAYERVWEACEGLLGAKARRHEGTQGAHV
jgi:heptosyltransferase-2